jgi:hypothetical protein
MPSDLPSPGLRGDYTGSCLVCLRGTDTGMIVIGEPDWVAAARARLGLPIDEAITIGENDPVGKQQYIFRVCSECADRSGARVGPLVGEGASTKPTAQTPTYRQPD